MVDFSQPYMTPMDQAYDPMLKAGTRRSDEIETPIFPISSIGVTTPETGGGYLQSIDASIRMGAGKIQLVGPPPGSHSAGMATQSEEVRQAIRELQMATGAKVSSIEMPNYINSLSGFNKGEFSEDSRQQALNQVKDTIKFVGDIAGGGGVEIVSMEFPRNFSDSKMIRKEEGFVNKTEHMVYLVDSQSGKIVPIDKKEKTYTYRDPKTFQETEQAMPWRWEDFENYAKKINKAPEQLWIQENQNNQLHALEANVNNAEIQKSQAEAHLIELRRMDQESEDVKKLTKIYENQIKFAQENINEVERQKKKIEEEGSRFKLISEYGSQRAAESYAEAGIWAMQESKRNQYVQRGKGSIYVGAETPMPGFYGSHPDEWIELIRKSRNEMVKQLTNPDSPYYEKGITQEEARELAKQHIKGELDTAHLNMWLQHYKPDLPWDQRVKEFKGWYRKQIEKFADVNKKEDIIGTIQMVDSATGEHAHLPPGQGIIGKDMFEYMRLLKEKGGYKGDFISEGHQEEQFGKGRIFTKALETLNSPIGSGYLYQRQIPQFRDIAYGNIQTGYGFTGITQSYVPSNDFTLWSNVPLE